MRYPVPHPIPYQGSKRRLATAILTHMEGTPCKRLVEPFAGSAAITLAAAHRNIFVSYCLSDCLEPLVALWEKVIATPEKIADGYGRLWYRERERPIEEFYTIRSEFNEDRDPAKLLYLLARCVKNAVRFNPAGEFNQSPDKRRKGTHPDSMRRELEAAHRVLAGRTTAISADFIDVFNDARAGDFFYLDPPYQGTSDGRDSRYVSGVSRERMIEGLEILNRKGIPFVLSYDGACGDKTYGERLPEELAVRILLDVGRSSQATLNGRDHVTVESLYISHGVLPAGSQEMTVSLNDFVLQRSMAWA